MIKKKDRSLLPYGDSTLAPSFTSTDKEVARWKDDKNKNSDDYFKTKAGELENITIYTRGSRTIEEEPPALQCSHLLVQKNMVKTTQKI